MQTANSNSSAGTNADSEQKAEVPSSSQHSIKPIVVGCQVLPRNEFDKDAIVARYGKDGMTYFTGEFTPLGEGIFSKCPSMV
jgi:hypothetical protein